MPEVTHHVYTLVGYVDDVNSISSMQDMRRSNDDYILYVVSYASQSASRSFSAQVYRL